MSDYTSHGGGGLSAQNCATIETLYRAFAGEPDLLDQVVTPGWQDIPLAPGQGPGPEGIKPMIRVLKEAFPDIAITVHDVIAAGDLIAVRAEITGTHAGASRSHCTSSTTSRTAALPTPGTWRTGSAR